MTNKNKYKLYKILFKIFNLFLKESERILIKESNFSYYTMKKGNSFLYKIEQLKQKYYYLMIRDHFKKFKLFTYKPSESVNNDFKQIINNDNKVLNVKIINSYNTTNND